MSQGPRRDPDLIDRSKTGGEPDPEAEKLAEAERTRARGDAAVGRAETYAALSWVGRAIGTAGEARTIAVFAVVIVIVLSTSIVFVSSSDITLRTSILDLYGKVMLIGIGFLAGRAVSRRG